MITFWLLVKDRSISGTLLGLGLFWHNATIRLSFLAGILLVALFGVLTESSAPAFQAVAAEVNTSEI